MLIKKVVTVGLMHFTDLNTWSILLDTAYESKEVLLIQHEMRSKLLTLHPTNHRVASEA
jgi:hypothetical protein